MKLINYAESTWLLGDEAADILIEYSVLMARGSSADAVEITALDRDGGPQTVSLVLGPATMLTVQGTESEFAEPENADAVTGVRAKIAAITTPPMVTPSDPLESQSSIGEYDF